MQGATPAEQSRFLRARQHDPAAAALMWKAHATWREQNLPLPPSAKALGRGLPMMARFLPSTIRCKDGNRVLVLMGAMYDDAVGGPDDYTRAFAALIDEHVDRDSDEKFTVCVDARGGDGWRNPGAWSVLPWVRSLASVLSSNFPERLHRLILFPVPWIATAAWGAATALLDEVTSSKMVMVAGNASRDQPIPEAISEHLDAPAVDAIGAFRKACYGLAMGPEPPEADATAPAAAAAPPSAAVEVA